MQLPQPFCGINHLIDDLFQAKRRRVENICVYCQATIFPVHGTQETAILFKMPVGVGVHVNVTSQYEAEMFSSSSD